MKKYGRQLMSRHATVILVTLISMTIALHACTDGGSPPDESQAPEPKKTPVFTTPIVEMKSANGKHMLFGIEACKVYRLMRAEDAPVTWELLFKPAPYVLPQQCVRERLEFDGAYIQIEIGTQAIGAGGCCTNYAAYRSRDGERWEIRPATSIAEWQALDTTK